MDLIIPFNDDYFFPRRRMHHRQSPFWCQPQDIFDPFWMEPAQHCFTRPRGRRSQRCHPMLAVAGSGDLKETKDAFEYAMDVLGFGPDEIEARVNDGLVTVEARHQEKDDKTGEVTVSKYVKRSFTLPENSDGKALTSSLNQDGTLVLVAPKINNAIEADTSKHDQKRKRDEDVEMETSKDDSEEKKPADEEAATENKAVAAADNAFELSIPVRGFQPDELSVRVVDSKNLLEVCGKSEEKDAKGRVTSLKQFARSFPLPEGTDLAKINSSFTKDGRLRIEAPKKKPEAVAASRQLPIQREADSGKKE